MTSVLPDVARVTCCKLLGIFVDCNLNFSQQVDQVVKVCSQLKDITGYLLQQVRKQGQASCWLFASCFAVHCH